jgi:hypothetical protein
MSHGLAVAMSYIWDGIHVWGDMPKFSRYFKEILSLAMGILKRAK